MSGSFTSGGTLDLADGRIIFATGKKKSGKSVLAKVLFDSFPGDKVVIDIAGDDGPRGDVELEGTVTDLPPHWQESWREDPDKPVTIRYVPDAGSETFPEDVDHIVGLVMARGAALRRQGQNSTVCLLVHEIGVVAPVHATRRNMKRLLMHNRHSGVTAIFCGPRPAVIDPLVMQQADIIYCFELMNSEDRDRLAKNIGWNSNDFSEAVMSLGPHEYVRFDANEMKPTTNQVDRRLVILPALPAATVRRVVKSVR